MPPPIKARPVIAKPPSQAQQDREEFEKGTAPKAAPPAPFAGQSAALGLYSKYDEFRLLIRIDPDRLDIGVMDQAQIYMEVGEQYTSCCSLRDGARDQLAKKDSELARECRLAAETRNIKVTVDQVNDAVLLHPDRTAIKNDYEQLKALADKWGNLKAAFEQRMRMLREMVVLYSANYFTSSTQASTGGAVRDALANKARDEMDRQRKARP